MMKKIIVNSALTISKIHPVTSITSHDRVLNLSSSNLLFLLEKCLSRSIVIIRRSCLGNIESSGDLNFKKSQNLLKTGSISTVKTQITKKMT